jgi:hypothetical protein
VYSIVKSPNSSSVRIRLFNGSTYTFSSPKRRDIGNTNDLSPPTILGVPATCLKSDSFRVAAAFTLLLRPYRKYKKNQSDLQAKPRFSRYHSISEVLISTFAPPRESLNHGLTFWLVSCYSTELIDIDTRSYRISLVRRGEYETVCQELEISLAVYRYDRLITLTFTLHSKFH